jgi:hypothetical protein
LRRSAKPLLEQRNDQYQKDYLENENQTKDGRE